MPPVQGPVKDDPKDSGDHCKSSRNVAAQGFSPSALTTYIRNPLDFYKQYVLGLREREEVEETVAYNTLGNVVHDSLEKFYEQWLDRELTIENLEKAA